MKNSKKIADYLLFHFSERIHWIREEFLDSWKEQNINDALCFTEHTFFKDLILEKFEKTVSLKLKWPLLEECDGRYWNNIPSINLDVKFSPRLEATLKFSNLINFNFDDFKESTQKIKDLNKILENLDVYITINRGGFDFEE